MVGTEPPTKGSEIQGKVVGGNFIFLKRFFYDSSGPAKEFSIAVSKQQLL